VIAIANNCAGPPQVVQIFAAFQKDPPPAWKRLHSPIMRPSQNDSRGAGLLGVAIFVLVPIAGVVSFLWLAGLWQ
jgi:hypothetical protein